MPDPRKGSSRTAIDIMDVRGEGQVVARTPAQRARETPTPRCNANLRKRGEEGRTCRLPAGHGTDHFRYGRCKFHGGAMPSGKKAAARQQAVELVRFYGAPIDTNPIDALLDEVRRSAGHVAFLNQKVTQWQGELDDDQGIPTELLGWIQLYQAERAQLVKVAKAALDAGVNERLVQIAEHQGMRLANAIEAILLALHLTPEQRLLIPEIVPPILRGLTLPAAIIEVEDVGSR